MKTTSRLVLVAAAVFPLFLAQAQTPPPPGPNGPDSTPPASAAAVNVTPAVAEVVKLSESGVGEEVVLSYIQNSKAAYNLSADDVFYLKDVGLSSPVITAMLNHDKTVGNPTQQFAPTPRVAEAPQVPQPLSPPPPAAPTYVSNPPVEVNYFYNDLAPYGTWVVIDGYGWCWQPRAVVINRGWRPYCDDGHWIYSDAGWYWASDYSWGWAPFHYGRWYMDARCGWVWMPDRVWAPAWVTWRVAGDGCGWAPLPPRATFEVGYGWRFNGIRVGVNFDFGLGFNHFVFVGLGDFCDRDIRRHRYSETRVKNVYKQTTIINNTTVVNNNTVVNRGVPVERVSAASRTEIRKASIRELPAGSDRGSRVRVSEKSGTVLYRPELTAPARSEKMVAQKVDERHPVVQHNQLAAPTATWKSQSNQRGSTSINAPERSSRGQSQGSPQNQPSPKNYQTAPAAPASPARGRSEERSQPAVSATPERRVVEPRYQPSPRNEVVPRNEGQRNSGRQTPQYSPKGYEQYNQGRSGSGSSERQDFSGSRPGKEGGRPN